tara:strand:- start:4 stop:858 length:855 start_codon:yes stop_codon:yes gene_type:complete
MMVGQKNFIKMKAKPIPKEFIDKIELRVGDIEIPPNDHFGFEGYLLKDVLVPYVGDKRVGHIAIFPKVYKWATWYELRYYITSGKRTRNGSSDNYRFNRIAYIILNKDDPRVIETQDYYYIEDGFVVDHDKDIELQGRKFIIKPDTESNLQLLTHSENRKKSRKKINNLPNNILFDIKNGRWRFLLNKSLSNEKQISQSFAILKHGYVGAYLKAIDACNEITGSNHIPDLKHIDETLHSDYKTMTEEEYYQKHCKKGRLQYDLKYRKKKQMNSDDQLDLGLSLT